MKSAAVTEKERLLHISLMLPCQEDCKIPSILLPCHIFNKPLILKRFPLSPIHLLVNRQRRIKTYFALALVSLPVNNTVTLFVSTTYVAHGHFTCTITSTALFVRGQKALFWYVCCDFVEREEFGKPHARGVRPVLFNAHFILFLIPFVLSVVGYPL